MRVVVLVGPCCLLKFPEQPLRLEVNAQAQSQRWGADVSGRRRGQVQSESVLQSGVDLNRGHPAFLIGAAHEALGVLRVDLPETTFSRFVFLSRDFDEALVQRQVVTNGVLRKEIQENT